MSVKLIDRFRAEVLKEISKISTQVKIRFPALSTPAIVIPRTGNPRLGIPDRASHFPIRHWKNVSIELDYITAAGGRGDPARIRPVRGSFHVSSSLIHSRTRRGRTDSQPSATGGAPFFSLVRARAARRLSCKRIFLLIDKSQ